MNGGARPPRSVPCTEGEGDLHALVEAGQNRHETIDGEPAKLCPTDAREIGGGNPGDLACLSNRELALVKDPDDTCSEPGAELLEIRVGVAEVSEHVSAATDDFESFAGHLKVSFSRLRRSRTKSISASGVLIPLFDFF